LTSPADPLPHIEIFVQMHLRPEKHTRTQLHTYVQPVFLDRHRFDADQDPDPHPTPGFKQLENQNFFDFYLQKCDFTLFNSSLQRNSVIIFNTLDS
jgi:hypothetical protein